MFLPRYRGVPAPDRRGRRTTTVVRVPDPRARTGSSDVTIVDVAADGYRLRLVDHPPAFDRDGFYGDAAGDYADNAWRFGLFCRAALEALRADGRPVDVLHLHDWHAGPAAVFRDAALRRRPDHRPGGDPHDAPQPRLSRLDAADAGLPPARPAAGRRDPAGQNADGIDLLAAGIERAELVNTVSPGFAAEALTPDFGMGLDGLLRSQGDRFFGILNGLDTDGLGPGDRRGPRRAVLARPTWPARRPAARTC